MAVHKFERYTTTLNAKLGFQTSTIEVKGTKFVNRVSAFVKFAVRH